MFAPSKEKAKHDHSYLLPPEISVNKEVTKEEVVLCLPSYPLDDHEFKESCFRMKKSLNVSDKERKRIEMETRDQSLQQLCYDVRSKQISGSNMGGFYVKEVKLTENH